MDNNHTTPNQVWLVEVSQDSGEGDTLLAFTDPVRAQNHLFDLVAETEQLGESGTWFADGEQWVGEDDTVIELTGPVQLV